MKKIRVLIFTNRFRSGGSERQAIELVKRLNRSQFEAIVAGVEKDGGLSDELPFSLDEVHGFPVAGFFNSAAVRQAGRFLGLLRQLHVQVVQCFDFYSNIFAIPVAWMARVPVIVGSRRDEASMRTAAQRTAELFSYRLATAVVANAERIKDQLVRRDKVSPERVWVIHNGLDLDRFDRYTRPPSDGTVPQHPDSRLRLLPTCDPRRGTLYF